jgi:hypothetical protein
LFLTLFFNNKIFYDYETITYSFVSCFVCNRYAQGAVGDTFTAGGIEYKITSETPAEVEVGLNAGFAGTSVDIPASVVNGSITYAVTAVGSDAFKNKSSLTTVTLSEGVKVIGSHAFRNSGITSIVIPNSVEALGGFVFYGCNALTSVEIGNGVTQIDVYAFNECANLKTVKIGTGLTTVNNAFTNCPLLDDVTCLAVTPPTTSGTFGGTTPKASATLSVPLGSVSTYQTTNVWKDFGTIQVYTPTSVHTLAESGIALRSGKNSLLVTVPSAASVSVFSIIGSKVYDKALPAGTHSIALQQGVYIVKVGKVQEKIVVR